MSGEKVTLIRHLPILTRHFSNGWDEAEPVGICEKSLALTAGCNWPTTDPFTSAYYILLADKADGPATCHEHCRPTSMRSTTNTNVWWNCHRLWDRMQILESLYHFIKSKYAIWLIITELDLFCPFWFDCHWNSDLCLCSLPLNFSNEFLFFWVFYQLPV